MEEKSKIEELFELYEEEISTLSNKQKLLVHKKNGLLDLLRNNLVKDTNEMLDQFLLSYYDCVHEEVKQGFIYGFSLAVQLMNQSMKI